MAAIQAEGPDVSDGIPQVPINFVPATEGESFALGQISIRVMEDGSRTDNRISTVELTVPAKTNGPPPHWHEMHDETFLVTQGTIRFTWYTTTASEPTKTVDAHAGDYVVVPIRSAHTFCNATDKEAKFINTFTPAFYVNYFKLLAKTIGDEKVMTLEANKRAMASYATIPLPN